MSHKKRPLRSQPSPNSLLAIFSKESRDTENGRKRKQSYLGAHDEIDNASSSSSSSSLSLTKNESKLAPSQNDQFTSAKTDNVDSYIDSDGDVQSTTSQISAESHFHEGDETRRRQFDNSILLYSTGVMKCFATDTTQEMINKLGAKDERKNSQQLALASDRHTKTIIEAVRRRLRENNLPEFYASIGAGDTCKDGMERINKERALAVEKTALLSSKLAQQKEQLEKRLDTEIRKRDKLKEEEEWIRETSRKKVHPFIASYLEQSKRETETRQSKKQQTATTLEYIPAPPGTMAKLLDTITSNKTK